MPQTCDDHIGKLAEFIKGRMSKVRLRESVGSDQVRHMTAESLLAAHRHDKAFMRLFEPLTSPGSRVNRIRVSALKDALIRIGHEIGVLKDARHSTNPEVLA